ncbi:L,D-transpeptidase [Stakelama saccharophila]|uniref:L,D-transpeptidase n=1 Tax=Stakelama saccharophila TaxID=3075605 RepID=A0ABZ0B837_9SPHN|nr:L,D-transpeptidase [Stakelama sp. W311]WNO53602.1 L,D-transpeptidase [Stakelama sp. W311]
MLTYLAYLIALTSPAVPATAQAVPDAPAATAPAPSVLDGPIEKLKPGEYLWAPQIAPDGPVTMVISLAAQRAFVYRNGVPIGVSTISSGKPGHRTPTGVFTILQKDVDHHSNLYNSAPMPFMQRLTWDGIALHAGDLPGYPASHGCIRLPLAFAKLLFDTTELGLTVVVTDDACVPEVSPAPSPLPSRSRDARGARQAYRWMPERAPHGPVSIVVSGRDRRIVVLRNGVEIGSASVSLDAPITRTQAFTLRAIDAKGAHWMRLPLPETASDSAGGELSAEERAAGHVAEGFRTTLEAILEPGATMLVTRGTLASSGTGARLPVLEADPGSP